MRNLYQTTKIESIKMDTIKLKSLYGYRVWISLFALLLLTVGACSSTDESDAEPQRIPAVTVSKAGLSETSTAHRFSGTVASQRTVQISTKVTGRVTQLDVEEGDYVSQGEILVRIKDDNLQAQKNQVEAGLSEAEAAFKNSETNYQRIKNLYEKESATQKELDDIATQFERAKANVNALEAKLQEINDMLEYTVLEAPFNGYVVEKRISEGDLAGPGQPLLAFEREGDMKVNLSIPESQIALFQLNDTVSVDVPAVRTEAFMGVVASVNPSGMRGSRQFGAEIVFPNLESDSGLKSGMFAEVSLAYQQERSITVPESALVRRGQLAGIYTLNDNSEVVLRWIRVGETDTEEGTVEVLSGLAAGETYVASFDAPLTEGQKVDVK